MAFQERIGSAAAENDQSPADGAKKGVKQILNYKLIAVLIIITVVINGAGWAFRTLGNGHALGRLEHDLGTYHFSADPGEAGDVSAAQFHLHIAVLDGIEKEVLRRLTEKKFRVQQDVEELLRRAHGGDFADPSL